MDEDHRVRSALVLGSGTRSFLTAIRSLGRAGVQVHVGWFKSGDPALRSRYIHRAHDLPPYAYGSDDWKLALIDLMKRERFDLIIPCHDQVLIPLQVHRCELESFGRLAIPSDEAFAALNDKFRTLELARDMGVPAPRSVLIYEPSDARLVRENLSLPVILKPRSTYESRTIPCRHGIRKAEIWDEVDRDIVEMLEIGPVAVQATVPGRGVGIDLLALNGEPLLAFQHERVHELPRQGSTYRKSVPLQAHLSEAAARLLKPIRYTGVAMVEFKVDDDTGEFNLMEVNPRFWGSMPLSVAAGADFPAALFAMLVEGQTSFNRTYRTDIYCRNLPIDIDWLGETVAAARAEGRSGAGVVAATLWQALVNVATLRERNDSLVLDDPVPGLLEIGDMLRDSGRGKMKLEEDGKQQALTERDIARGRARDALEGAKNVLFVCYGNICRSPFAEYFARRRFPEKRITSTGYHPKPNRSSPPEAVDAASEWDLDLTPHRSSVLSDQAVNGADAIFVFDEENYRKVVEDFPGARDRVHFVGALSPDGMTSVEDPWGKDEAVFRKTYEQIAEALETVPGDVGGDGASPGETAKEARRS